MTKKDVPRCELAFRDGKVAIVCETKADQKQAYDMVAEGILIEVKKPKDIEDVIIEIREYLENIEDVIIEIQEYLETKKEAEGSEK